MSDSEKGKMQEKWSDEELAASVDAYQEMARCEAARRPYNKRQIYRDLEARFGRSWKAYERRMQNISAVLDELGEPWIPGLKPATHVGGRDVKPRLVAQLKKNVNNERSRRREAAYVAKLPAMRDWLIAVARSRGKVSRGDIARVFGIGIQGASIAVSFLTRQSLDRKSEPALTAVVVHKRTQRCNHLAEHRIHDDEAERQRLYEFWSRVDNEKAVEPSDSSIEVKAARFVSVEARPDQAAFRRRVFLACGGRCVISGCDVVEALDAAHKRDRDWRLGHNRAEDGYLMRKDLHALYDAGLLCITDEGDVALDGAAERHYGSLDGVKVLPAGK